MDRHPYACLPLPYSTIPWATPELKHSYDRNRAEEDLVHSLSGTACTFCAGGKRIHHPVTQCALC